MPQITFFGYVLPRNRNTTFHAFPEVTLNSVKSDLQAVCKINIHNANVSVSCALSRDLQGDDLFDLYIRIYEIVRTALDVLSFANGMGFTLVLNEYIVNNDSRCELVIEDLKMGELCTSFSLDNPDFIETVKMFVGDPKLGWALKDLIEANTLPNHASITCARAVESLRVLMTSPDMPRGQAWGEFQDALRLTREFREFITGVSTGPRHGDRTPISRPITLEITRRAWQIMDRYIAYRKRGSQPLPEADFPLL